MRVLQVLTDDDRRGAQVFATELGDQLIRLGHDVRTVGLAHGEVGGLDIGILGPSRHHRRTIASLRRAMAAVDVTAGHGSTTLPLCALASAGPGRPFVYRQISDPVYWTPTAAKRIRTRALYRFPNRVVALSPTTSKVLQSRFRVPAARIDVIPNAVDEGRCPRATISQRADARTRLGLPPATTPVVGYVGALVPEKGVADLIDAADPGSHLVLAGEGPERSSLERRAADRGVDATFLGTIADPWDVYAAADILAVPSRGGDTQPAVLIEAAMVGTPVVSTNVGAIADLVIDGETGRLVAPSDVEALRRALVEMASQIGDTRVLAERGWTRAHEQFSTSAVADRWADTLSRACG